MISAAPGTGRASFQASNMAMPDFHDFVNSISPSPSSVPSHVGFTVEWAGGGDRTRIHDTKFGFEGNFVQGNVSIDFTTQQDSNSVVYRSNPHGQQTILSGVGHERNGSFFR